MELSLGSVVENKPTEFSYYNWLSQAVVMSFSELVHALALTMLGINFSYPSRP